MSEKYRMMHGQNNLFNRPLAIDKGYLMSVISNILLSQSKNIKIEPSHYYEYKVLEDLENQIVRHENAGATHFPLVLNITGPIVKYTIWGYVGTQFYCKVLKELDRDPRVSGILLNIDSGGGMLSGTSELTDVIKSLEKSTIAYTNGYMCSAALDIASGADYRIANPNADLIGSIGTMLSYQDFSKLFEKYGAVIYEIYAPQSTEKNIEFRELEKGNQKLYEDRLKQLAGNFISRMKENFGENLKDDGHVFKGKTYTPKEALSVGLINELGTIEQALSKF